MSDQQRSLYTGEAEQRDGYIETSMTIDPDNLLFGINAFISVAVGATLYTNYPGFVKREDSLYPDPDETATCVRDEVWALDTSEITAWTAASNLLLGAYGFGFTTWLLNQLNDGKGGRYHALFNQTQRLLGGVPLLVAWRAMKVENSYVQSMAEYTADTTTFAVGSNLGCQQTWLYSPENIVEDSIGFMNMNTQTHKWMLWVSAVLSFFTYVVTSSKLTAKFELAKETRLMEEEMAEEEHEEEEPAQEEEDFNNFF